MCLWRLADQTVPGAICQPPPGRESPLCDGPSCPRARPRGITPAHTYTTVLSTYTGLVWSGLVRKSALARSLAALPASTCTQAAVPARTLQQGGFSTTCGTQNWPWRHPPTTLCVSPARHRLTSLNPSARQPASPPVRQSRPSPSRPSPAYPRPRDPPPPPPPGWPNRPTQLAQKESTDHAASPTTTPSSLPANHRSLRPTAPLHQTARAFVLYLHTKKRNNRPSPSHSHSSSSSSAMTHLPMNAASHAMRHNVNRPAKQG